MGKVRMADIAEAVGVTTVTVSNALNNRPGVSDELRQRIVTKAREMGYTRIRSPKERAPRRTLRLGIIVPAYYLAEPSAFYWRFHDTISREAASRGMIVGMEQLDSQTIRHMIMPKMVNDRNFDLLVLLGPPGNQYLEMVCSAVRQPCVCLDCSSPDDTIPTVISANYYGMAAMTGYLIRHGHTKIGFLGTVGSTESINDRYLGYRRAIRSHELEFRKSWQIDDRKIQDGKVIIELPDELPEAMVCNSDRSAVKLIEALAERGLRVPEDISIVSYDGYKPSADAPDLTTMAVNVEEMSRTAVQCLVRLYEGRTLEQWRYVIPGDLVEGETVRERNPKLRGNGYLPLKRR